MGSKIHQPLGQERKSAKKPQTLKSTRWKTGIVVFGLLAAILGGAGWLALSAAQLEGSDAIVVAQSQSPEENLADGEPNTENSATDGDSNLVGNSTDLTGGNQQGLPTTSGKSGAEISSTFDENGNEIVKYSPTQRDDPSPVLLAPPNRVGQDPYLAHLPDPAIIEDTPAGKLPIRGANGERPFDIYARPWSGARGARVVIIVGGLGLSQTGSQYAIATLPEEVTLAFAANGNSLQRWMQEARRKGHEILLQIPFEPFDYPTNDPGPGTLTVAAGPQANLDTLHAAMGRITNYTGITNFMGGRFLADPDALEPVMRDLAKRGLMFVDDGTSARSLTDRFAKTLGVPYATSDVVLDGTQERGYILKKLDELERIARRNGVATGVASAFEVSVDAIETWAEEAKSRGIEIVPASAVADDPER